MPKRGIFLDEIGEKANAFLICEVDDLDAVFAQPIQAAAEIHGLPDNYFADAKLTNQSTAIPARRKRGNHNLIAIAALPARFAKSVRFRVHGSIVFLNAAVMAAPKEFSVAIEKRRANRNASFGKTKPGLGNGGFEKCEMILRFHFAPCEIVSEDAARRQPFKTWPEEIVATKIRVRSVRGILAAATRILG